MKLWFLRLMVGILFIFISLNILESTTWATNHKLTKLVSKSDKKIMCISVIVGIFPWYAKWGIINQITGLLDRGFE